MQENLENREELQIDLREIFYLFRQRLWIILLCAVLGGTMMYFYTKNTVVPQYSAASKIYIFSDTQISGLGGVSLSSELTQDFILLATSRPVMEEVISELNLNMTSGALAGCVSVSNPEDSHLLIINVLSTDPVLAKDIANTMAEVVARRVAEIMKTDEPNIMEEAIVPTMPVDSGLSRNVILGVMAGAVIVMGVVLLLYILDDTIKDEEDVEKYLKLRTLTAFSQKNKRTRGAA